MANQSLTIQNRATIAAMLEQHKGEIARALPRHMTPDRMARIALTEFSKTPKLLECDPKSLFGAIIQCSQLGLEPGGVLGHAYLIPFENRRAGTVDVQLIIGYKGLMELIRRSGQVLGIAAHAVYSNDVFIYEYGLEPKLIHKPAMTNRGEIIAFYAAAQLRNGGRHFEVMSKEDVDKIRAGSRSANSGPWVTHYEEMGRKTAIRRIAKFLPVSIELRRAIELDEQAEANESQSLGAVLDVPFETVTEPDGRTVATTTGEVLQAEAS